jgi:hypothetical protein
MLDRPPAAGSSAHRNGATRAAVVLIALAAGCAGGAPAGPAGESLVYGPVVRRQLPTGLVQRVEFAREELRGGDTLHVRSVVVNEGAAPQTVTHRICGLGISAEVPLTDPFIRCGGHSAVATLAPGDSVVQGDARVLPRTGHDGTPLVRVHHLVDPHYVLEARIRLRP